MSAQWPMQRRVIRRGVWGGGPEVVCDYGVTRIVLLPIDTLWMHAYWEVAPYTWDAIEKQFGREVRASSAPLLRLHSTRGHERGQTDIPVRLDARNWYIHKPLHGNAWFVELGLMTPEKRFILLTKSNEVMLPAGKASTDEEQRPAATREPRAKIPTSTETIISARESGRNRKELDHEHKRNKAFGQ